MARIMHLFGCSAPPVLHIRSAVDEAQTRGWQVFVGLTPTAADWLGPDGVTTLESQSGASAKVHPRPLGVSSDWPPADVVVVAPTTLNTLNAIALGLTPTAVTGSVVSAIGAGTRVVVLPCLNAILAAHPQVAISVKTLRAAGVSVLLGDGGWEPNPPGRSNPESYPWHLALDEADHA